jgi:signal transduction histidine kinase
MAKIKIGNSEAKPAKLLLVTNGGCAGYAGSVTDITEIKGLEQRKDDFIKMPSHELKTPITSINGYVQLLLNIYNKSETEALQTSRSTVKSSLGTIAKQATKLKGPIDVKSEKGRGLDFTINLPIDFRNEEQRFNS